MVFQGKGRGLALTMAHGILWKEGSTGGSWRGETGEESAEIWLSVGGETSPKCGRMELFCLRVMGRIQEVLGYTAQSKGDSLVAQKVKNLLAMHETWVPLLGREDPLEKGMAILSSILT